MKPDEDWAQAAKAIADELPDWTLLDWGPRDHTFYMTGPDDVRVLVSKPWNDKTKVSFSVSPDNGLHEFEGYKPDKPQANVSMSRDPKAAARDVTRRCLKPSVDYVQNLRMKKAISDRQDARRWEQLDRLASALGGNVHKSLHSHDGPMQASASRGKYGDPRAKFKLASGHYDVETDTYGRDRVNVEIGDLDPDGAAALGAWLRQRLWPEKQGKLF